MKSMYKILLFVGFFQLVVIMINVLNVFPYTLYGDVQTNELASMNSPLDVLAYFFEPPELPSLLGIELGRVGTNFTFGLMVTLFVVMGALISARTHSWTPIVVILISTSFVPMILKSITFFNEIIYNWDVNALAYLGLILGFGIIMMIVFTIMETPTHGRS